MSISKKLLALLLVSTFAVSTSLAAGAVADSNTETGAEQAAQSVEMSTSESSNKLFTAAASSIEFKDNIVMTKVGCSKRLLLNSVPANARLEWRSSNPSVARVDSKGNVTGLSVGTSKITCTASTGQKASCAVAVSAAAVGVKLNTNSVTWEEGRSGHFKPTLSSSVKRVTYKSSNTRVATVDSNGLLTAVGKGTCTVTCTAADGSGRKDTCKVTVKQPVRKLTISGGSSVNEGSSIELKAVVAPSNATNKNVTWSSSDKTVAKVSSTGKVTALKAGKATIKCTAKDGSRVAASKTVTVKAVKPTGQKIADYAAQWVGVTPYVWGGTSLYAGADCSGFVCCIYENFGYDLWDYRVDLDMVGDNVSLANAQPGDIVVYPGHVAIYAGNGMVTHALNENVGVLTTPLSWGGTVRCVRRVVD